MGEKTAGDPTVISALVDNHRHFLAFLEQRVGNRPEAEDILQAAFVRGIEKSGGVRASDSAVAWSCGACASHGCLACDCDAQRGKAGGRLSL